MARFSTVLPPATASEADIRAACEARAAAEALATAEARPAVPYDPPEFTRTLGGFYPARLPGKPLGRSREEVRSDWSGVILVAVLHVLLLLSFLAR